MPIETAISAFLCPACFMFAWAGDEDRYERMFLALVMAMELVVSNMAWQADTMRAFAMMDALVLLLCIAMFYGSLTGWRLKFTVLAFVQLLFDIANEIGNYSGYSLWAMMMDALAFGQFALVAGPSGGEYVGRIVAVFHRRPHSLRNVA